MRDKPEGFLFLKTAWLLCPMAIILLAERRKPSGECLINAAKPEGSRPAATKAKPQSEPLGASRG